MGVGVQVLKCGIVKYEIAVHQNTMRLINLRHATRGPLPFDVQ